MRWRACIAKTLETPDRERRHKANDLVHGNVPQSLHVERVVSSTEHSGYFNLPPRKGRVRPRWQKRAFVVAKGVLK